MTDKVKLRKSSKDGHKEEKNKNEKESWMCEVCKKAFSDPKSNMLECERCCEHFCAKCVKVVEAEYIFLTSRNDIHWFCSKCDSLAMESVLIDKDLEEKISRYMKGIQEKLIELDSRLKEKIEKQEFDERMNKFVIKNTETINNLKLEIEQLKKDLNKEVNTKMEDDEVTFASIVAKHVDEKLEWVKGDVGDIHTSIEEAKISAKETKELLTEEKDKQNRKNNIILYRMTESTAAVASDKLKDDKDFCMKLLNEVLKVDCEEKDLKCIFRIGKRWREKIDHA